MSDFQACFHCGRSLWKRRQSQAAAQFLTHNEAPRCTQCLTLCRATVPQCRRASLFAAAVPQCLTLCRAPVPPQCHSAAAFHSLPPQCRSAAAPHTLPRPSASAVPLRLILCRAAQGRALPGRRTIRQNSRKPKPPTVFRCFITFYPCGSRINCRGIIARTRRPTDSAPVPQIFFSSIKPEPNGRQPSSSKTSSSQEDCGLPNNSRVSPVS